MHSDAAERRRAQNRVAQRSYRKRVKERLEVLDQFESALGTAIQDSAEALPATCEDISHPPSARRSPSLGLAQSSRPRGAEYNPSQHAVVGINDGAGKPLWACSSPPRLSLPPPPSAASLTSLMAASPDPDGIGGSTINSIGRSHAQNSQAETSSTSSWATSAQQTNGVDIVHDLEPSGVTALHHAAANGHVGIARRLVENAADIEAHTSTGRSPLQLAAENGHINCVDFLITCGSNLNTKDFAGMTALHYATVNGHLAVVRRLVTAGADVEAGDAEGVPPLHRAAASGNEEIVNCLIQAGADVHSTS